MEKWYTKYTEPVVAKLKKCIYGTKQSAKYYYDKVITVMKEMKWDQSRADPLPLTITPTGDDYL